MFQYLVRRILLMIPTLVGVAIFIFFLLRVIPGDLVELKYASESLWSSMVSDNIIEKERERLGLDKPVWYQFAKWAQGIIHGDFGISMWTGRPVAYEINIRFRLTLQLAIMATIFSTMIAIPLGMLAALKQDTWIDYAARVFAIAGLATPSFWLGIIIILSLLIFFRWLPPLEFVPLWKNPWTNFVHLIFPVMAVGYRKSAVITRMVRSTVLEVLREDYIRTASAKGLRKSVILIRHALKNAMLPVISIIGMELAFLLGGLVVTEQVFNLNGIGLLLVKSIEMRDYTMVQTIVLLISFFFIIVNFFMDILYAFFDPRVRYK